MIIPTLIALGGNAFAQEERAPTQNPPPSEQPKEEKKGIGLNVELELASAYLFRGDNLFKNRDQDGRQLNQHMRFSPGITWSIFDTGFSVGYWSAWQLNGNVQENIDAGFGAEQDLIFTYKHSFGENLVLTGSLVYYFYPMANSDIAEATFPSWLDPGVGITYTWLIDLSMSLRYFTGLQEALREGAYTYFNPSIGKTLTILKERMDLALNLGFGYKLFNNRDVIKDNAYDILFTAAAPIKFKERYYVKPNLGISWTNISADEAKFSDKVGIYGAALVGADF